MASESKPISYRPSPSVYNALILLQEDEKKSTGVSLSMNQVLEKILAGALGLTAQNNTDAAA